jgi:histidyl-tRNA synthetase
MIQRTKGTQDFCDLSLFNTIVDRFKQIASRYAFIEIATPILEPFELFHRSLGTHTDVVSKEMFFIQTHDADKEKICLRPEATASTMRAFLENGIQRIPWKVFSYGPMFRYERPQKGRFRQFHQINIEIIASSAITEDVQLIVMLDHYFAHTLLLKNYTLAINYLGCADDRKAYTEILKAFLRAARESLCANCKVRSEHNPLRVFDCKVETCQAIYQTAPVLTESLCGQCHTEWEHLQAMLRVMGISAVQDTHLVRGLDYYNKTVFEFRSSSLGAQNAFCGGGRYDSLAREISGKKDYPSVGAALGIERLMLLLESDQASLIHEEKNLTVVMPMAPEQITLALIIATELRNNGLAADLCTTPASVKSMMRSADKDGATFAILIGEQELHSNSATIKNMKTGTQETVKQTEIVGYIKGNR